MTRPRQGAQEARGGRKHMCSAWVFPPQIVGERQALACDRPADKRHGIWHTAETADGWFKWAKGDARGCYFQTTGPWDVEPSR